MASYNFSFVTLEYLEANGNRLRWNSALNIPINGLAAFIILKYSTPAMGMYKYFILATVLSAFIMDFHSSFIYGFFDIIPTPISCPTGITKNLGWFWGTTVNFVS
uniref:Uncharacterized protein n=1 Tax=Panagrolaimus sp. PS1159 TaxID=55785 RepID=A0AC35FYF4_9BILA